MFQILQTVLEEIMPLEEGKITIKVNRLAIRSSSIREEMWFPTCLVSSLEKKLWNTSSTKEVKMNTLLTMEVEESKICRMRIGTVLNPRLKVLPPLEKLIPAIVWFMGNRKTVTKLIMRRQRGIKTKGDNTLRAMPIRTIVRTHDFINLILLTFSYLL